MCLLYQQSLLKRRHQRVKRLEESVIVYTVTPIMMIRHGCNKLQTGVRPARSRATARTGWRDATSRPALSRGHLASAEPPLYEKDSGTVTGEREERFTIQSGKIQQAKSPTCSVNLEDVLKAFRPKPTAESSTPIQKKSDPIWT
ncbi:uncharacterized protein B0T23DRAFT_400877 [Neurospora hispaniola]|uniref:Uncharacterized protein n=1 Tax=Neurospora hispaniola TaxID=588809 RepID=A0AAJ0MV04_9PEZI|nr:hypothetical protein B0T23DRAFT_400877 [Neurospora hispaniola]